MKSLLKSFVMASITCIAVFAAIKFELHIWMVFIALCSFFLFGATYKTAFTTFTQQAIGVSLAILCQVSTIMLSSYTDGTIALLVSVFILTIGLFFVTKLKVLNRLPAYFMGLIIWFASGYQLNPMSLLKIVLALSIGYLCAYINTIIENKIEQRVLINDR